METRSKTLQAVMDDLDRREALGRKKYLTDVDRPDLTHKEWLQHAYEETLDKALYLKRAIDLCDDRVAVIKSEITEKDFEDLKKTANSLYSAENIARFGIEYFGSDGHSFTIQPIRKPKNKNPFFT